MIYGVFQMNLTRDKLIEPAAKPGWNNSLVFIEERTMGKQPPQFQFLSQNILSGESERRLRCLNCRPSGDL